MKNVFVLSGLALALFATTACEKSEDSSDEAPVTEASQSAGKPGDFEYKNAELLDDGAAAEAAVMELGSRLKAQLQTAMEVEGPIGAARVCSEIAPVIAEQVSEETGFMVGRTSLKTRNPANSPDAWEAESMERFLTSSTNGFELSGIDRFQAVEEDGVTWFRYAKPIVMQDMCTVCHGTEISSDVQAAIHEIYPEDQATGFAPGEMRGAFTAKKVLDRG